MTPLKQYKVACENWWWNRKLQVFLNERYGVRWPLHNVFKPFNTRQRGDYLFIVQNPDNLTWWFAWGTEWDFANADLPDITARELLEELGA